MDRIRTRVLAATTAIAVLATAALLSSGCGGTSEESSASGDGGEGGKLTLVAYSTPEEAYHELIPAFNKTPEGKGVGFEQSYASSGEQSRAVEGALPADVVEF
jgi:sulfate/thiosulfate transport system substrate-binding protein